jgi:UDPglucose 6-dehydrogenase
MKIGVIGNGYVGGALAHGFSPTSTGTCEVKVHDVIPERSLNTLDETVNDSDKFPELNIVFNPEFLTEKSARLDFINQSRIVLGGDKLHTAKVAELFNERFKYCHIIQTDYKTSEMIKYFCNVFFSVKVSFANEMKQICDTIGADWSTALEGFVADGRVGDSHLNVPGPDGKMGFGGSCFPKDINAFMSFASSIGVDVNTINGAWETNLNVRPEEDWKELKGRAVVDE